jgi:hypothetical protein
VKPFEAMVIKDPDERDKTLRVFKYLRDLNKLSSASRTNSANQVLWFSQLFQNTDHVTNNLWKSDWVEEDGDLPWVELKKPPVQNPKIPVFSGFARFKNKLGEASAETKSIFAIFSDFSGGSPSEAQLSGITDETIERVIRDIGLLAAKDQSLPVPDFREFLQNPLNSWLADVRRLSASRRAYQTVFATYHDYQKQIEELELVLGIGLLTWAPAANRVIARHLLTLSAEIEFNAKTGKITINAQNLAKRPSIETDMLEPTDLGHDRVAEAEKEITELTSACCDIPKLNDILGPLANCLGKKGEGTYQPDTHEEYRERASEVPVVTFSPALILRKRTAKAFINFVQTAIDTPDGGILSTTDNFSNLCESADLPKDSHEAAGHEASIDDQTIFFPLARKIHKK